MKKVGGTVVYIVTKLELGGAQKVCLSLWRGMHEQGFTTHLISGDEGALADQVRGHAGVHLVKELKREVGLRGMVGEFKAFINLISYLRSLKKIDPNLVVHTHSTKAGIMGRWAAFFARVKHRVHTVHGFGFHAGQSWPVWMIHFSLELLTSFITTSYVCVSRRDIETGARLLLFFRSKAALIRAAVDDAHFIQPARRATVETVTFGSISCFKPQKNVLDLLAAFAAVKRKVDGLVTCRLEIVGDGEQRSLLEQFISQNNLESDVILHGWCDDVSQIMATWDAYVMSSLWEGLPCAVVEARLMGLPVVAYDVGGISEVIHSDINGFVVPPGDQEGLAEKMCMLAEQPKLRHQYADYHDDLDEFRSGVMIEHHTSLYQGLRSRR